MKQVKKDQWIGALFVVAGIIVAIGTLGLKADFSFSYPGAKLIPGISAFLLIVCGVGIYFEGLLSKKEEETYMDKMGVVRMLKVFAVLCLYILGLNYLGFLIASPIMLFVLSTLFAEGKTKICSRIIYSVVMTAAVYALYTYAFSVRMPPIKLF